MHGQSTRLYLVAGVSRETEFAPKTRNEIRVKFASRFESHTQLFSWSLLSTFIFPLAGFLWENSGCVVAIRIRVNPTVLRCGQ